MKIPIGFLTAAMLALPASGVLHATAFRLDSSDILSEVQAVNSLPVPRISRNKWWSAMGSAHKPVARAALAAVEQENFPDIARYSAILVDGSNDESGHVDATGKEDMTLNGGFVEDLWFGKGTEKAGGVLPNYLQFKFEEAYRKLGIICHLTQDQAVPAHAANIKHGFAEPFESYSVEGNKTEVKEAADGDKAPYAYYQELQDDTRRRLASWLNPENGLPYWTPSPDAPPLGKDATYGPWGAYGAGGSYTYQTQGAFGDGQTTTATMSPGIRVRQLAVSALATVNVLKAASRRLPPLVSGLALGAGSVRAGEDLIVRFKAMDNRSRDIEYQILAYKAGEAAVKLAHGPVTLNEGQEWTAVDRNVPTAGLTPGNYTLDVRLSDKDGNTTPDEVNTDGLAGNNTTAPFVIH